MRTIYDFRMRVVFAVDDQLQWRAVEGLFASHFHHDLESARARERDKLFAEDNHPDTTHSLGATTSSL